MSINNQLRDARNFISMINKEDLLYLLKSYNHDEALLHKGTELFEKAEGLVLEKKDLEIDYRGARSRFRETSKEARAYFMKMSSVVKKALSDDQTGLELLEVKGITPRTYLGWTTKAKHLYKTMETNPDIKAKLKNEIDPKYKAEAFRLLNELDGLFAARENLKGKYQQSTLNQRKALKQLHKWRKKMEDRFRDFYRSEPKQLVKLGIAPLYPPKRKGK